LFQDELYRGVMTSKRRYFYSIRVQSKANSKRGREPWLEIYKSLMRKYIETTIGEISKLFPKKIYTTNLKGFLLKIALFLFAYQIDKAFIQ